MTLEERSTLVLALTRVLYVNGQDTDQTLDAAERLGDTLRVRSKIMPRWGELQLQAEDRDGRIISAVAVDPAGVEMDRVASTMRAIEELGAGRLAPAAAMELITKISKTPPAPTWLFTLAAAAGAVALAVIFGVQHLAAAALIFVSAGAGAILRRSLAKYSANVFLQPFCASLLAGGSVPVELVTAPCRGLPMHDPGAGATCPQWRVGPHQGPHPSRRRPPGLFGARDCGDLDGTI